MTLGTRVRDWWRGWSDEDQRAVIANIAAGSRDPGEIIYITERQMRALAAIESQPPVSGQPKRTIAEVVALVDGELTRPAGKEG